MKVISFISQIVVSIFFLLVTLGLFIDGQTIAGIFMLLIVYSISPLFSILLNKLGNYTAGKKVLFKCILIFISFIGMLASFKASQRPLAKKGVIIKENEQFVQTPIIDTVKLKSFQKKWADSMVKDWDGTYIQSNWLSASMDTIYFQLGKLGTKGNWQNIADINQRIFQNAYDSSIKKFGNEFSIIKTVISLQPDIQQLKENEAIAERNHLIKRQFSGWDNSNVYLKNYIRQNMNDPSSYEHIKTTYVDKGSYILVTTVFRGKNAFGAKIIDVITAKIDLNGNILSVIYQD